MCFWVSYMGQHRQNLRNAQPISWASGRRPQCLEAGLPTLEQPYASRRASRVSARNSRRSRSCTASCTASIRRAMISCKPFRASAFLSPAWVPNGRPRNEKQAQRNDKHVNSIPERGYLCLHWCVPLCKVMSVHVRVQAHVYVVIAACAGLLQALLVSKADPTKLLRRLGDLREAAATSIAAVKARTEAETASEVANSAAVGQADDNGNDITLAWGQDQITVLARAHATDTLGLAIKRWAECAWFEMFHMLGPAGGSQRSP